MHIAVDTTYIMFIIFFGTAVLSTFALMTKQSLLVAYILLGALLGPFGLKLVGDSAIVHETGEIGIIFLLFLLGLHLHPQNLWKSLKKMSWVTLISSLMFFFFGAGIGILFHFPHLDCIVMGIAAMFSSTIIGLKLLPTTILHHQHTGELVISILLLQDLLAIGALLTLETMQLHSISTQKIILLTSGFPLLFLFAWAGERFILRPLWTRFDKIHEYIFILSIAWCLLFSEFSNILGLSQEIGAFIAGVAIASHPISFYIAENLKPLRDFFLVLFFFTVGASFNFSHLGSILFPALALGGGLLIIKPWVFHALLKLIREPKKISFEIGVRLGQLSEFSLLVIYSATSGNILSPTANATIQAAVIFSFIISCYWVVLRYPTPLATVDQLRQD